MKVTSICALLLIGICFSCGPKTGKSIDTIKMEIDAYITTINSNTFLKQEKIEGALTDVEGFKDIGSFEYTVFFDPDSKQLFKIENIENTFQILSETYYFKKKDLVMVETDFSGETKKIYFDHNRALPGSDRDATLENLLLKKAERFRHAFQQTH